MPGRAAYMTSPLGTPADTSHGLSQLCNEGVTCVPHGGDSWRLPPGFHLFPEPIFLLCPLAAIYQLYAEPQRITDQGVVLGTPTEWKKPVAGPV